MVCEKKPSQIPDANYTNQCMQISSYVEELGRTLEMLPQSLEQKSIKDISVNFPITTNNITLVNSCTQSINRQHTNTNPIPDPNMFKKILVFACSRGLPNGRNLTTSDFKQIFLNPTRHSSQLPCRMNL